MTSTREIPNQRINGIEMTEGDMFRRLINNLQECHTLARGIAQSRKEIKWLAIAGIFEEVRQRSLLLMNLRQTKLPPLVLLERER